MPARLKRQLEAAAKANGRSLSAEAVGIFDQYFADRAYPPPIRALAELLGRCVFETASLIAATNRIAGHGFVSELDDAYAYDQAMKAVIRLIEKARPEGDPAPHGVFATIEGVDGEKIGDQVGVHVADGFIEVLAGRHNDGGSRETLWLPRIREELGAIGDRLAQQPEADDYWAPATTEPGRLVMVPTVQEGVYGLQVEEGEQEPGDDQAEPTEPSEC